MSNKKELDITDRIRSRIKPENRNFISKNMKIAKRIRQILESKDLNVEDLAKLLGMGVDETYGMINGMYNLTLVDITKIETVLGEVIIDIK